MSKSTNCENKFTQNDKGTIKRENDAYISHLFIINLPLFENLKILIRVITENNIATQDITSIFNNDTDKNIGDNPIANVCVTVIRIDDVYIHFSNTSFFFEFIKTFPL